MASPTLTPDPYREPEYRASSLRHKAGLFALIPAAPIILKVSGVISWSWLMVLAPLFIPAGAFLIFVIVVAIVDEIGMRRPCR